MPVAEQRCPIDHPIRIVGRALGWGAVAGLAVGAATGTALVPLLGTVYGGVVGVVVGLAAGLVNLGPLLVAKHLSAKRPGYRITAAVVSGAAGILAVDVLRVGLDWRGMLLVWAMFALPALLLAPRVVFGKRPEKADSPP